MTETERRRLGERRRCVFQNLANGVPVERVMADLQLSRLEVEQDLKFVGRKITQHRVLRRQPTIPCGDIRAIRWNRKALLSVLACIGDLDLSTDLILKINEQALDHPEMVDGAKHRMADHRAKRATTYK